MRHRRTPPPLAILAAALLAAPAAVAALPHPPSQRIVPGRSIGGVRIGESGAAARAAWGPGWTCIDKRSGTCSWITLRDGVASLVLRDGRVAEVAVAAGSVAGRPRFAGPLAALRTSAGIGLGSEAGDVRRAYPGARRRAADLLLVAGRRVTAFTVADGRVARVTIRRRR